MLAYLEHANLFLIPLDDERRWYRYHHLFADLLRARLQQTWPERIPGLHVSASAWFEKNGYREEAILHAFAARDYERAARLIDEGGQDTVYRSDIASLSAWFRQLPQHLYAGRPWLCVSLAWVNIAAGQLPGTETLLQAAENAVAGNGMPGISLAENELQEKEVAGNGYAQINSYKTARKAPTQYAHGRPGRTYCLHPCLHSFLSRGYRGDDPAGQPGPPIYG